jgi:hypothetical protein
MQTGIVIVPHDGLMQVGLPSELEPEAGTAEANERLKKMVARRMRMRVVTPSFHA